MKWRLLVNEKHGNKQESAIVFGYVDQRFEK